MNHDLAQAHRILALYAIADAALTPILQGHINVTYLVKNEKNSWILQQLHPVFQADIHEDIALVSHALQQQKMPCQSLVKNQEQGLYSKDTSGKIWRLLTYVEGKTYTTPPTPQACQEAAQLLGRFHNAIQTIGLDPNKARRKTHDTAEHLKHLQKNLRDFSEHTFYQEVLKIAQKIEDLFCKLNNIAETTSWWTHGDPKFDNIVFDKNDKAIAMIDLDTICYKPITFELGDTLRSWCQVKEDTEQNHFSIENFQQTIIGYSHINKQHLQDKDKQAIPYSLPWIALELAVRFLCDTLEEQYFRWDDKRYSRSAEHQLLRAKSQYYLAEDYLGHLDKVKRIVSENLDVFIAAY